MAVDFRRRPVSGPSGVRDRYLGNGSLFDINRRSRNLLTETCNFADLLEKKDFAGFVTVNAQPSGVISSIFLTCQASTEDLEDLLATL